MERASPPAAACLAAGCVDQEDGGEGDDGDTVDLDRAFRRHASYVAAIALRLLGRDDEVDDVVQDVFVAAASARLRDQGALKGWLATVTVRAAQRRLRLRRLRSFVGLDRDEDYAALASPGAGPEERAQVAHVYRILDRLRVDERVAWTLRHVEGERLEDVAALTGCSLATAKRRIAAAQGSIDAALQGRARAGRGLASKSTQDDSNE